MQLAEGMASWQEGPYGEPLDGSASDSRSAGKAASRAKPAGKSASGAKAGSTSSASTGAAGTTTGGQAAANSASGATHSREGNKKAKPIGMHQDILDWLRGLTSIWAYSEEETDGGLLILTRAGLEEGKYPSTRSKATEAADNARSGAEGFKAVVVNPHENGGSYVRAFLGRGGCWHAGVQLTALRSASIHYTGRDAVVASTITRAAGVDDPTTLQWSEARRRELRGVSLDDDDKTLESQSVSSESVLTVGVSLSALLSPLPKENATLTASAASSGPFANLKAVLSDEAAEKICCGE